MRRNFLFVRALPMCLLLGLFSAFAFSQDRKINGDSWRVVNKEAVETGLCPFKNAPVQTETGGLVSRVTATPNFQNPFNKCVETVFALPSANDAAIDAGDSKSNTTLTTRETSFYLERGKGLQSIFSLAAGATQINESQSRFPRGLISVTGQRPTSNYFAVDGLSVNTGASADETSVSGNIGALPNLTASGGTNSLNAFDATGEVSLRALAMAKEGRVAGATIDFVSRRGSNVFRGSLFETFGNEAFNANDFFANSRGMPRAAARLNQFGGTLGGFLVRSKVWFFGNYEGLRLRQTAFSLSEVPSLTSRQNAAANVQALFNAFPLPNGRVNADGFAEFAAAFTNPAAHDVFGLRIDTEPFSNLIIGGNFNFAGSKASLRGDRDFSLNTRRNFETRARSVSAWTTYRLSSNMLVFGRVNFSRNDIAQNFALDNFGGAIVPTSIIIPAFDFLKYDLAGKNSALAIGSPIQTRVNQFQANGSLELAKGGHSFSFGADFRRLAFNIGATPNERSVLFSGANLSGTAARINELTRALAQNPALANFSVYAQDSWSARQKFQATFGLRWDVDFAPEIGTENISFQNAAPQMRDNFKNFAPRVNLTFSPLPSGRIVFRGGIGLYYDFGNAPASEAFANSFPFASGNFARNVDFTASPNNAFQPLLAFDAKLQTPRVWKILAEYQHLIFNNNLLTLSYMGAFGRRLFLTRTLLDADPNYNFVRLTNNDAESDFHAANLVYEKRLSQGFSITARYTFAKSIDNFSPDTFRQNVFVGDDLSRERGASDFDVRHQLSLNGVYDVQTPFETGALNFLTRNWMIFGFLNTRTAFPVNVAYARANDFGIEFRRPDLVSKAPLYTDADGRKQISAAAFSIPTVERQGTLGRNALRGFPFFQMDLGLERRFRFSTESNLRLTMEIFNLLNNTNFADMSGNLGTRFSDASFLPNNYFGQTTSVFGAQNFTPFYLYGGARTIQFSAKFVF